MRLTFVLLVLGAILLSITSATATIQTDNKKDTTAPNVEDTRFLRGLETTDSEERWGIRDLFGRKKFEKMLINDWDELSKYKTKTIISKLKGTKHSNRLLHYLNWRSQVNRARAKRQIQKKTS